jgi:peptidoglycan/LPS O-acetylase OafA/YrhL
MLASSPEVLLGSHKQRDGTIPALDGLRGLAAVMVFLRHAWSLSGRPNYVIPLGFGHFSLDSIFVMSRAVDLFFVLSGFLLARSFMLAHHRGQPRASTRRFYRQRAFRILPAYWLMLLLLPLVFTPWLASQQAVYSVNGLLAYLAYIPVLSSLFPWSFGRWIAIGPIWTLTLEVLFYLALPWIYRWFVGRRWMIALPLSLVITLGWLFFLHTGAGHSLAEWVGNYGNTSLDGHDLGQIVLTNQFPAFAFSFALGLTLSSIWSQIHTATLAVGRFWRRVLPAMLPVGTALVLVTMWQLGTLAVDNQFEDGFVLARTQSDAATVYYYLEHTAMALGFGIAMCGLVLHRRTHHLLERPVLRSIGILGYGIFLFHFPVLFSQARWKWLGEMDPQWHFPVAALIGGATTVTVAALLWFGLERPCIEFGRRKRPQPAAPAATESVLAEPAVVSSEVIAGEVVAGEVAEPDVVEADVDEPAVAPI